MSEAGTRNLLREERVEDGAVLRLILAAPKANILDAEMIAALTRAFREAGSDADLKCVVVEGEGPHFSFGASVPEHLPGAVESMLPRFHDLFRAMFDAGVTTIAAVRGQCLGGGLELAMACNRVVAAPGAKLGQPEIRLGVFAPVASVLLAERTGRPRAEDLCVTGRIVDAEEAHRIGLVDEIAEDPGEAALGWARDHLLPKSAAALRHALRAVRTPLLRHFDEDLRRVEAIYLDELMATADAEEGLRAFLEKREPVWRNK
ncbi:MAG TPA: cyclohexa-1,5-dienecarbonyl-CoA hydratase [bacterium]|nr:cyclohexa-1,5-dienecarbonyl-CoA hydratase [bacterium]